MQLDAGNLVSSKFVLMSASRDTPIFEISWNNILVPIDFSPASRRGLRFASAIADRFAAPLHLLHVIEPPVLPQWGYTCLALREATLRRAAAQELKRWPSESAVSPRLSAAVTLLALVVFGFVKGHFIGVPKTKSALQTALVGSLAAGVSYAVAKFIA